MAEKKRGLKPIKAREVMEKAILADAHSRAAYEQLVENLGVNGEKLLSLLCKIPYASNEPQPLVDGMRDRQVRALPDKIRSWARTIEIVNSSPSFSPDRVPKQASATRNPQDYPKPLNSTLIPELADIASGKLRSIPSDLCFYADHLDAWLRVFNPTGENKRKLGFRNSIHPQTWLTLEVLQVVNKVTNRRCYNKIATLLEAAYRAAGQERIITEQDLAKLRTNNGWITWVLHESSLAD